MSRRVGLIVYGCIESTSGGYLYDRKLVEALHERGWNVDIFSLPSRSYPGHLLDNLHSQLAREIESSAPEIVLQDELSHPSLVLTNRWLRRRHGSPIVSIVHHLRSSEHRPGWQNACYAAIERVYLRGVDAYVFNSQITARTVRRLAGERGSSIVAYPAGDRFRAAIDASAIRARARAVPPLRIVFVGNVIPRKGLEALIEAVELLPPGTCRLTVVGDLATDPGFTRRVRRGIHARGLSHEVRLAGRLSDDDLAAVLRGSHVLAVPSTYEGFGIAYLEGMSFGLPAVGTTVGGAGEIITDNVNGRLVPPGDPAELSRALLSFIRDPTALVTMSQAALERASAHPTWSESMNSAAEFIESLV